VPFRLPPASDRSRINPVPFYRPYSLGSSVARLPPALCLQLYLPGSGPLPLGAPPPASRLGCSSPPFRRPAGRRAKENNAVHRHRPAHPAHLHTPPSHPGPDAVFWLL